MDLAQRQREMNRLDTCLALGPSEALYYDATGQEGDDGDYESSDIIPLGQPVTDRLATFNRPADLAKLSTKRRARLARYVAAHRGTGSIVGDGLEGGRPASPSDVDRLAGRGPSGLGPDGLPPALARCPVCDQLAGEFLAVHGEGNGDTTPRVIDVHCQCANHNRCAACGEPLAESRLSAYFYSESEHKVWYRAAYAALSHRCTAMRSADGRLA